MTNADGEDEINHPAFNHGTVRPATGEEVVVNTGAVELLSGLDLILRQSAKSRKLGLETQWYRLDIETQWPKKPGGHRR